MQNELTRISERCSDKDTMKRRFKEFEVKLRWNGYPQSFIEAAIRRFYRNSEHTKQRRHRRRKRETENNKRDYFYFKFPYISDRIDHKIINVFQRENIPIRLAHRSYTLQKALRRDERISNTPCELNNCPIKDGQMCHRKGIVYEIECTKCHHKYIGSSKRQFHIRAREHTQNQSSAIYQHLQECQNNEIRGKILATDSDTINLRIKESILIKKYSPEINSRDEISNADSLIF